MQDFSDDNRFHFVLYRFREHSALAAVPFQSTDLLIQRILEDKHYRITHLAIPSSLLVSYNAWSNFDFLATVLSPVANLPCEGGREE